MTKDINAHRAATLLLKEHGHDAPVVAAQRADACLETGDLDGERIWLRIIRAIEGLRSNGLTSNELIH